MIHADLSGYKSRAERDKAIIALLTEGYDGFTTTPPEGCDFAVGDVVTYRNPDGALFSLTVKGFLDDGAVPSIESQQGRTMFIFDDCFWFPANPARCTRVIEFVTSSRQGPWLAEWPTINP